jgi:hypothetical protein
MPAKAPKLINARFIGDNTNKAWPALYKLEKLLPGGEKLSVKISKKRSYFPFRKSAM